MKNVPVCTFKTSPCMPAPRAHMLKHVCAWCRHTRGRFERTHRDVLSGHTEFRSVSHTNTPHHTAHTHTTPQHKTQLNTTPQHNTTQHITTTTPHGDRERQRQTETEKEDRDWERREDGREEERQEKTKEEKRREKTKEDKRRETREERRFIFRVVVHGRSQLVEWIVWLISLTTETFACYIVSSMILIWLPDLLFRVPITEFGNFYRLPVFIFGRHFRSGNFYRFCFSERQLQICNKLPVTGFIPQNLIGDHSCQGSIFKLKNVQDPVLTLVNLWSTW